MCHTAVNAGKPCGAEPDIYRSRADGAGKTPRGAAKEETPHRAAKEAAGNRPRIIAVCGVKNSGKTTLLERLVRGLAQRGVKTAVVKHDGHDFTCDVPDTDSYRMWQAGAYGTAVYSRKRMFVHKEIAGVAETELIRQFPEADLIFLEGLKDSGYPKIEVVRKEISHCPVSNPEGRFLIATDCEEEEIRKAEKREEVLIVDLNDGDRILDKVMETAGIV